MKNIAYILFILLLASCATKKNFSKFHKKHEQQAADICALWYPIKTDSVKTEIKYIKGKEITAPGETKYVSIDCDSVMLAAGSKNSKPSSHKVYISVPGTLRVDTFWKHDIKYVENTAKIKSLQDSAGLLRKEYATTKTKLGDVEKTRDKLWLSIIGLLIIAGLGWYVKIRESFKV